MLAACDLRVLVLTKRQYMGRDLLDDRYGRFRELPLAVALQGGLVHGLTLSYRRRAVVEVSDGDESGSVAWRSVNLGAVPSMGARGYRAELDRAAEAMRPNLIWACSDVPHAILGVLAARRLRCRLIIDLYDNFESYPIARLPGINRALATALRSADGVTCVSSPLRDYVLGAYSLRNPIKVIENAVDCALFKPQDKDACRQRLGLPANAILIGTAGSLARNRGIETLFEAFGQLARERGDVHLVLAGPLDRGIGLPDGPRVHYLGNKQPGVVPEVLSALDLAVICNRDSAFGRYCFPQKLYEAMACRVPVIVARVGAAAQLLSEFPASTYEPEDTSNLLARLRDGCGPTPLAPLPLPVPSWRSQGSRLASFFTSVLKRDA